MSGRPGCARAWPNWTAGWLIRSGVGSPRRTCRGARPGRPRRRASSTRRRPRSPTACGGLRSSSVRATAGTSGCWPRWRTCTHWRWRGPDGRLDDDLAMSVRTAVGWTVAREDVLAGTPATDHWHVVARSDTEEHRIPVRRTWLLGRAVGAGLCCWTSPRSVRASTAIRRSGACSMPTSTTSPDGSRSGR